MNDIFKGCSGELKIKINKSKNKKLIQENPNFIIILVQAFNIYI